MKNIIYFILGCISITFLFSCEKDNYDPPNSLLQGRLVYNGDPINVEYSADNDNRSVYFELWEQGWQLDIPIYVVIDQDGSYSALLFKGTYKLVFPNKGPFLEVTNDEMVADTITVNLTGNQTLDIEVMPYYMLRNHTFSKSGSTVSGSFDLEQVVTGAEARAVDHVALYIGKTQFLDSRTSISTAEIAGADIASMNNINLTVEVPSMVPSRDYVFARIGVKINGVNDMIFTPVEKVQL